MALPSHSLSMMQANLWISLCISKKVHLGSMETQYKWYWIGNLVVWGLREKIVLENMKEYTEYSFFMNLGINIIIINRFTWCTHSRNLFNVQFAWHELFHLISSCCFLSVGKRGTTAADIWSSKQEMVDFCWHILMLYCYRWLIKTACYWWTNSEKNNEMPFHKLTTQSLL